MFTFGNGYTPSKAEPAYWENGTIPWFRMEDIRANGHILKDSIQHISQKAVNGRGLFPAGSYILSTTATLGEYALLIADSLANQRFTFLVKKVNRADDIDEIFFLYQLAAIGDWCRKSANAGGLLAVNMIDLKNYEFSLPPAKDQRHIARSLSSIETHISALQALIAKYEAIKKATVNLLLKPKADWRQVSLGDIGDVLMCKRILKNQTTETGDVPFYKIGTFGRTPDSFISRALFKDFKARFSYPQKGDVLLSAAGTIGRTVVFNGEDAYFQDSNIVWIDNDERAVTNRFLNVLYGQMNWQTENGGTVSRLYNANIRNTKIKIPSLSEQKRIVAILDSIDGTINGLKSQLAKAQDIKQGMMSYFFG